MVKNRPKLDRPRCKDSPGKLSQRICRKDCRNISYSDTEKHRFILKHRVKYGKIPFFMVLDLAWANVM